jgi:transmembrane sensor
MSGAGDRIEPEGVAEAAARWFVRLQDEAATGDDWLAFEAWLAASPEHTAAYERLEQAWVDLDAEPPRARNDVLPFLSPSKPRARPPLSRRAWLATGAGLAASVAVGVLVADQVTAPAPAQTYVTAPGQTREIRLSDGTRMRLNASSRVTVRFEKRARRVEMADAEAAFDVTHDPQRPFLIAAGDREIRVVGTEFNVRRRDGALALTVRRGVVEVRPAGRPEASPARVAAGHRLTHREGAPGAALSKVEPDAAFGWTQRQLIYEAAPLREVATDLSRSLGTPVRVADAATGQRSFTGVLVLDDRDAVLRRLESFASVRAERRADGVVLTSR